MTSVDVAVIGRGPIGSAAARHLAEMGVSTALIGPGEPVDRATSAGPFSSHADEGRITRITARNVVWSELASRSILRYGDIAHRADIDFHVSRGLAVVRPDIDDWIDAGLINGSNVRKVDADWLRQSTGIDVRNGLPMAYEGAPAGYINPRRLVAAQTKLAATAGATIVDRPVEAVEPIAGGYEIAGPWGAIRADRLLVATGAFGRGLLEGQLVFDRVPRTTLMAEMADSAHLPSLIMAQPPDGRLESIHWVPPVRYPDGRMCLKIGGSLGSQPRFEGSDDAEIIEWFHGQGDPVEIEALEASLRELLPDAELGSLTSAPCVITNTPSGYPYIGWLNDGLAVAIGGNGEAAKSSDEIGRLAATLFAADGWTDSLDQSLFAPQLA